MKLGAVGLRVIAFCGKTRGIKNQCTEYPKRTQPIKKAKNFPTRKKCEYSLDTLSCHWKTGDCEEAFQMICLPDS
jgi:hypothetical protein